jgi:hypothetical protein
LSHGPAASCSTPSGLLGVASFATHALCVSSATRP